MSEKFITIWDKEGNAIEIFESVAKRRNLKHGQRVSDQEANTALVENCKEGIAICQLELAIDDFNKE